MKNEHAIIYENARRKPIQPGDRVFYLEGNKSATVDAIFFKEENKGSVDWYRKAMARITFENGKHAEVPITTLSRLPKNE